MNKEANKVMQKLAILLIVLGAMCGCGGESLTSITCDGPSAPAECK